MALPTLDATFASSADLPRKQMLAKWLVEELGETQAPSNVLVSGAGSSEANGLYTYRGEVDGKPYYNLVGYESTVNDYSISWDGSSFNLVVEEGLYQAFEQDVSHPWLGIWITVNGQEPAPTVTEIPQPIPLSSYYSLPERYLWAKIAVAAGGPKTEADYISLPTRYVWSDIYNAVSGDIANSTVVVSGAGTASSNGTYVRNGSFDGKPAYNFGSNSIIWSSSDSQWFIFDDTTVGDNVYASSDETTYPWQTTGWVAIAGSNPVPILTPQTQNHTDWSENVALGHIAAAYRGDTANPANLATYIDWPWRYKVASIILAL